MARSYETANAASRERMQAIAENLPDTTLVQPIGNGWSIAGAFAHVAFWDQAVIARWDHWRQTGEFPQDQATWLEVVNAAASAQWQALPPRWSVLDAVSAAGIANDFLASLTEDEVTAAHRAGFDTMLDRSIHRNAHMDDVEKSLVDVG
jgi:hypothetical protein